MDDMLTTLPSSLQQSMDKSNDFLQALRRLPENAFLQPVSSCCSVIRELLPKNTEACPEKQKLSYVRHLYKVSGCYLYEMYSIVSINYVELLSYA